MAINAMVIDKPEHKTLTTFDKIQELKRILSDSQVNEAVRRYNYIIKLLGENSFIVSLENTEYYMTIFHNSLLEQKIMNVKGLS